MTRTVKMLTCLAGSILLCASSRAIVAESGDNPYSGIVERNLFGLKPPAAPVDPASIKPPPPRITLTGITTILGKKRALMKVLLPGVKPGQPPTEQSLMLAEGQRDGEIELLGVDMKEGMARVDDYGTITNLTFEKDGVKAPAVSTQPGIVGAAPPPVAANPFAGRNIPTRALRVPTQGATGTGNSGNAPGSYDGAAGANYGAATPSPPSFSTIVNAAPAQSQAPQMDPEQAALLIEANHAVAIATGDPMAAILPPTMINPTRNVAPGANDGEEPAVGVNAPGTPATTPTPQIPGQSPGFQNPGRPF